MVLIWMLGCVRKRNKVDNFEYQALRDVVKEGGEDVIKKFEKKFKEMKVEGNRKSVAGLMFTDPNIPQTHEAKYMNPNQKQCTWEQRVRPGKNYKEKVPLGGENYLTRDLHQDQDLMVFFDSGGMRDLGREIEETLEDLIDCGHH